MNGVGVEGLEAAEANSHRANFVFSIDSSAPLLAEYILQWTNSEESQKFKRILHASKVLKRQVRFFLEWKNEQANLDDRFYGHK